MSSPVTLLHEAVDAFGAVWSDASDATELCNAALIGANDALGALRRRLDAAQAQVAAEIARQSRPELGPGALAKQQGFRNTTALIAASSGSSNGDASRLVKVGQATAPRSNLIGERLPAKRPHLQEAMADGRIGAQPAGVIVEFLDGVALRVPVERVDEAERMLVRQAPGLELSQLRKLITRIEAWIDPDGIEPRDEEARAGRHLSLYERAGMLHLNGAVPAADGAPLVAAIKGFVNTQFQARPDQLDNDTATADHRSVQTMQADALVWLADHALSTQDLVESNPLGGAQVMVRISLDDLRATDATANGATDDTRTGLVTIDGIDQPISITAARRYAAGAGIIPWVCGGQGEILDHGRTRRLFTRAQKRLLVERDGGCAMCGAPPGMARVHHIDWWQRDHGNTDLDNGVLLCTSCHHRIHDNGWDIRIDGTGIRAKVWFIPPPTVDQTRTPRLGGRARFDLTA